MVFSSMVFLWVFLPVVLIVNWLIPQKISNIFLLVFSLLFYAWGEPIYVLLMLVSILINWIFGLLIERFEAKKLLLAIDIAINLGILGYFKYANMLVQTINRIVGNDLLPHVNIALPIGISFFTFQAISYVVDLYRGHYRAQKNVLSLALYISFFPQLIAGPIVKYKDIDDQIENRTMSIEKTAEGIRRFIYGLGKKVLISNVLGYAVDTIYALPLESLSGVLIWAAVILYTFQIYYDFSGYSDMAIGLGKMMGFEFLENFNYPYMSSSIREFWNRWHISLSSWFKEYLYIPLGGNRKGVVKTYRNLFIVFFLTGLWHGASNNFIVWGLYHGFFSVIERLGLGNWLKKHNVIAHIYTFFVVSFGWIFFRVESVRLGIKIALRMCMPWMYMESPVHLYEIVDWQVVIVLILAVLGMGIVQKYTERKEFLRRYRYSILEMLVLIFIMGYSILTLAANTYNPFIYFRF